MWGKPKNLNLKFLIEQKICGLYLGVSQTRLDFCDEPYYLDFGAGFSFNDGFYDTEAAKQERYRLAMLIGKKIVSAEFIKKDKGDIKFIFDSGDQLIIHEDDWPYESYTMQTPEGLMAV